MPVARAASSHKLGPRAQVVEQQLCAQFGLPTQTAVDNYKLVLWPVSDCRVLESLKVS